MNALDMDMFRALVMREQEILRSKGMGADANYIPGGELTGMFQAVVAPPTGPTAPPPATLPTHQPDRPAFNTAPVHHREETAAMRRDQVLPAPPQPQSDNTRKVILGVIALGVIVLLMLLGVIVMLLLDKG